MATDNFPRLPPSGIKVIVVGAGFAGLTAAIECDRKGHSVVLLEKVAHMAPLGDIISFGQNGARIFAKWPGVMEAFAPILHNSDETMLHHWQGETVAVQSWVEERRRWGRSVNSHRGEMHLILLEHARQRGTIDVRLGAQVVDYFEDEHGAGVELATGERLTADVVLAAEGVKSKGRKIVLGFEDAPKPSGYAVYRAWYPAAEAVAQDPRTRFLVENGDSHHAYIGPDVHFIAGSVGGGKQVTWVCTHKDDAGIDESWQFPGRKEDVLACLEGWAPAVHALVEATPPDRLFDYKLVYRDPLPTFVSPGRRIALIGDAAHPFLPTSIQGASQSMEDGVAMAACLDAAGGRERVREAVAVWERIRYGRVHKVQEMGVKVRNSWHHADWDAVWKKPELLYLPREEWILNFDAEEDAYASYERVRDEMGFGKLGGQGDVEDAPARQEGDVLGGPNMVGILAQQ